MSYKLCRALGKFSSSCGARGYSKALFTNPVVKAQNCVTAMSCNPLAVRGASLSTSKKDSDTTIVTTPSSKTDHDPTTVTGTKKKYWTSMGFDWEDEDRDRNYANGIMFTTVTIGIVFTGFVYAYWPDHRLRDWSQREAYIEIARREALGLPHVDPNVVPPENINLPTEEELGDFDVIV